MKIKHLVLIACIAAAFLTGMMTTASRAVQEYTGQQWEYLVIDTNGRALTYDIETKKFTDWTRSEEIGYQEKVPPPNTAPSGGGVIALQYTILGEYGWEFAYAGETGIVFKRPKQ